MTVIAPSAASHDAEAQARTVTDSSQVIFELANLATSAAYIGDRDRAFRLLGDAEALARTITVDLGGGLSQLVAAVVMNRRSRSS